MLGLLSGPLAATEVAEALLRGQFEQEKYLAELTQPLVSRGRFVLARGQGLIWTVETPVDSTLVLSGEHLLQLSEGRQTLRVNAGQQPGLGVVASVMMAVFEADTDSLAPHFELTRSTADDGRWQLDLLPRNEALSRLMERLRITGAEQVERVEIDEPGGDRSVIHIDTADSPAAALSEAEQQLLDGPR